MVNRRSSHTGAGATMVEMSLVIFVVLTIVMGVLEFGRYYYFKSKLTKAARQGLQLAVREPSIILDLRDPGTDSSRYTDLFARVQARVDQMNLPTSSQQYQTTVLGGPTIPGTAAIIRPGESAVVNGEQYVHPTVADLGGRSLLSVMKEEPIVVETAAEFQSLLPFFGSFLVRGQAMGTPEILDEGLIASDLIDPPNNFCGDGIYNPLIDGDCDFSDPSSIQSYDFYIGECPGGGPFDRYCDVNCDLQPFCGNGLGPGDGECWESCESNDDCISQGGGACVNCQCQSPACGDGVQHGGEICGEPGLPMCPDSYKCDNCNCVYEASCGNGFPDGGEQCGDPGTPGCTLPAECNQDHCVCEIPPGVCENGVLEPGETCEPGVEPCSGQQVCVDCECVDPYCGDGYIGGGEECDPNGNPTGCALGSTCQGDCTCLPDPVCPNGILEDGEECETGIGCSDPSMVCGASEPCQCDYVCGNGIREGGEECDGDDGIDIPLTCDRWRETCNANCEIVDVCNWDSTQDCTDCVDGTYGPICWTFSAANCTCTLTGCGGGG